MKIDKVSMSHADVKHFTGARAQQNEIKAREAMRQMGQPSDKPAKAKPTRGTPEWAHTLAGMGTGDGM